MVNGLNLCPGVVHVFLQSYLKAAGDGEVRCADDTCPPAVLVNLILVLLMPLSAYELEVLITEVAKCRVDLALHF